MTGHRGRFAWHDVTALIRHWIIAVLSRYLVGVSAYTNPISSHDRLSHVLGISSSYWLGCAGLVMKVLSWTLSRNTVNVLSFCCRPFYCFHFRHLYLFFNCLWKFCVCFTRAAVISAPGAWLSCSSRLDARVVSLLDVLWANKWLIDWLIMPVPSVLFPSLSLEVCPLKSR